MTSFISCCFKKDLKLLKVYNEGLKMINKEFDVLQLFKSKKHNKIKKKLIDLDLDSGESNLSHYTNSEDDKAYETY